MDLKFHVKPSKLLCKVFLVVLSPSYIFVKLLKQVPVVVKF